MAAVCLMAMSITSRAEEFSFHKEIAASSKSEESLVAAPLDAEVYAATQDGFADIRLRDAAGTELPFIIRKSQEMKTRSVRRRTWSAPRPTLKPLDDGGLEITLELGDDDPHPNGLSLITPLRNFEQRVRIQTSTDGITWDAAANETVIFDYSRYMDVRSDSVPFPETARKHIRIVIDDVTSEQQSELLELTRRLQGNTETERTERVTIDRRPFRIEKIEFWQQATQENVKGDHKRDYPIAGFKVTEDAKAQQTIITVQTHREPLTSLTIETSSRNFSRNCSVEIMDRQGVQTSWRKIGSATLSQMEFQSLKRDDREVSIPETRASELRLVIDNRDSAPLTVTSVKAEGNVYEVVFLAATNKPHQLAYGNADAREPKYDTATIQALLTESYRPEALTLGAEQRVATTPPAFNLGKLIGDPRLLTGIIVILVIALGWGLYMAVKRVDISPPTDTPNDK
jgi:hypothetical protein